MFSEQQRSYTHNLLVSLEYKDVLARSVGVQPQVAMNVTAAMLALHLSGRGKARGAPRRGEDATSPQELQRE